MDAFRVSGLVNRRTYALTGLSLAMIKYAIEFAFVWFTTSQLFSPLDFVNPWLSSKAPFLHDAPAAGLIWLMFTIPFVWIAVVMSVRRAADVGVTPWVGMLMLIPILNLVVTALLAVLPSGSFKISDEQLALEAEQRRLLALAYQPTSLEASEDFVRDESNWGRTFAALDLGCLTQVLVGAVSVWIFEAYGFILFFSAPVIAGSVAGFVYNGGLMKHFDSPAMSMLKTAGVIILMNISSFIAMLCLGLDGAICLIMAYPLLGPLSILGGWIGRAIATAKLRPGVNERRGMAGTMFILPLCLGLEWFDNQPTLHAVTTSVDIAAPPQVVWDHVIEFPEIDAPLAWYFELGIAAPKHATISGHGVGAIRHCEFTTGPFVEPITVWLPPQRLAFDVTSQPLPMKEWTPFSHLHPPHLDSGFQSRRGEFRLEPLANGGTRLHGTTWYEIDVRPRLYWKSLADPVLHSIHRRVLEHIAKHAEASQREGIN